MEYVRACESEEMNELVIEKQRKVGCGGGINANVGPIMHVVVLSDLCLQRISLRAG